MVGAGIGHALVPELAAEPGLEPDVEFVPVAGGTLSRRISIFWHRDRYRSRAAETFVEMAREVGASILQHPVA
jgi:DNA-binding transcriptional LysR family regulator